MYIITALKAPVPLKLEKKNVPQIRAATPVRDLPIKGLHISEGAPLKRLWEDAMQSVATDFTRNVNLDQLTCLV